MTLWFCARNPETPWLARLLVVCVVAYALSPIDLIPDFIPVLGYLDDAILLPLGILLALRLLPPAVLAAGRQQAEEWERRQAPRLVSWPAAGLILLLWALAIVLAGRWLMP
ncbi:YkvA family protein [Azotobacter salinestris]|uniref:YkvA family protein n=1 Tax=Azotobacter salinestris TaxID=69964 RepID=UPI0032DEF6B6